MSVARWGGNLRWVAGAAGAVAVLGGLIVLVRVPPQPPLRFGPLPKPAIQLGATGGKDVALTDQATMHDQMPLFLPTDRNVTARPPAPPEAGRTMLDRDVRKFAFAGSSLALGMPAPVEVPANALDTLRTEPSPPLYGFGRVDRPAAVAQARGALVKIVSASTQTLVLTKELALGARPPTEKPWQPLEFLALISAEGLAAPLAMPVHSQVEEVDNYFRNYLVRELRIGEILKPGSYRIIIGP